jgi:adenylate cyclase
MKWQLYLYKDNRQIGAPVNVEGIVDLGRQDSTLEKEKSLSAVPFVYPLKPGVTRVVMEATEKEMLRHLELEMLEGGRVRVRNLSGAVSIAIDTGGQVPPKGTQDVRLPAVFRVDKWSWRAQAPGSVVGSGRGHLPLSDQLRDSRAGSHPGQSIMASVVQRIKTSNTMPREEVIDFLRTALEVLQEVAAAGEDFLARACQAVVDQLDMDGCRVLLYDGKDWAVKAEATRPGTGKDNWRPSFSVLDKMLDRRETQRLEGLDQDNVSLAGIADVVAAPIFGSSGIVGALYGDRAIGPRGSGNVGTPINEIEVMLTDVFAYCVAAGLARIEQEQRAVQARVLAENAFGPDLAPHVLGNPEILKGKDAKVSILFCDLRKFSTHSEKLGPERTVEWISQVMGRLSECVRRHGGIVVDFIGDELMAMWGAPVPQDDHAIRACRAALDMLGELPALNEEWQERLKEPMGLGIGVNSGVANVGNVGTAVKQKYGALGNTVNLASRVQGVTKHLKTRLLITRSTKDLLNGEFATRRITLAEVVNIKEPVELFELSAASNPVWSQSQKEDYETALEQFEAKHFGRASLLLSKVVQENADDGPSLVLLSRAVNCMIAEPPEGYAVWKVPGK